MVFVNGARVCNLALRFRELYSSNGYSVFSKKQDEKIKAQFQIAEMHRDLLKKSKNYDTIKYL